MKNLNIKQSEVEIPGDVYLCQVNDHISCGACCGLYNIADASKSALQGMLTRRTSAFTRVERSVDALTDFAEKQVMQLKKGPFPEFHHCPYVGLIGPQHSRIGCLLHPLADGNNGTDFRGLSYYGGMACRIYFCPSCHRLAADEKRIIREAAVDWYIYGLVITETRLLSAFFKEVENRMAGRFAVERVVGSQTCLDLVNEFLALKVHWPFRILRKSNPCNYFFEDRRYRRAEINYTRLGVDGSRFDPFFKSLVSNFDNRRQLHAAEVMLDGVISRVADAFKQASEAV